MHTLCAAREYVCVHVHVRVREHAGVACECTCDGIDDRQRAFYMHVHGHVYRNV